MVERGWFDYHCGWGSEEVEVEVESMVEICRN